METSQTKVDTRLRAIRRRTDVAGEDQGLAFRRLLDSIVEVFGRELAELHEEISILESKLDGHFTTLRTDISHVRQQSEDKRKRNVK